MTESMIERVARAAERKHNPQWDDAEFELWWTYDPFFCHHSTGWPDGFRGTRKQRRMYEARTAIEAMREPTDGLHEAAEEISVYYDDFSCGDGNITLGLPGYREKFNQVWQQLITAALEETP